MDTLGKLDELIALIDGPCNCDNGTCRLCRIMGRLWDVRNDLTLNVTDVSLREI